MNTNLQEGENSIFCVFRFTCISFDINWNQISNSLINLNSLMFLRASFVCFASCLYVNMHDRCATWDDDDSLMKLVCNHNKLFFFFFFFIKSCAIETPSNIDLFCLIGIEKIVIFSYSGCLSALSFLFEGAKYGNKNNREEKNFHLWN